MLVFKILRADEWAAFDTAGSFTGSADDQRDGYIHLSTAEQAPGTLAKYFTGVAGLVRVTVETEALGDALRWEVARGGAEFPHLYRALERADIVAVALLPTPGALH